MKNGDVITSLNILFGKKKFNLEIAIKNLHILMDSDQKQLDLYLVLPIQTMDKKYMWLKDFLISISLKGPSSILESKEGPEKSL